MARDPPIQKSDPRSPVKNAAAVVLINNPSNAPTKGVDNNGVMAAAAAVVVVAAVAVVVTNVGIVATHWMHWA